MKINPWDFLDDYRGKKFDGQWPSIPAMFRITVLRYPGRPCFRTFVPEELTLTYSEALDKILGTAARLLAEGLSRGDKIALTGKNSPEWAIAYLGILFAGGVVVPLDYQLKSSEILGLMGMAHTDVLFCDEEKYDGFSGEKQVRRLYSLSPAKADYILDFPPAEGPIDENSPAEDDLAAILFTSGTTGVAKGVMLTHKNFVSDCYLAQANMNIFPADIFYALLPLHHSYSMLAVFLESISVGASIIFAKSLAINQILADLKKGEVTMLLSIPMLFNKIIKALLKGIREKGALVYGIIRGLMGFSGFIKKLTGVNIGKSLFNGILAKVSLDTNRICISGGGPLPPSTFKRFNQMGIDFVQGYGLTETAPIVTLNPVEAYEETSVGKVIPQVIVKIDSPDAAGIGEILVKGPNVMLGYFENAEATSEIFDEEGWLKTGDMGRLDSKNYLYLTGRSKNLIVTEGGKNVFPEEIEDCFQLYDEVEQVMVRGYISDERMKSEGIEAFIYPVQEEGVDTGRERFEVIIDEVNRGLKPYQRIGRFTVLEEPMEMTTTKKIKRHAVNC